MGVDRPASLLVVGFAGGAVCMSVQRYLPLARLTACDLDAIAQEKIAKRYFGESHCGFRDHRAVANLIHDPNSPSSPLRCPPWCERTGFKQSSRTRIVQADGVELLTQMGRRSQQQPSENGLDLLSLEGEAAALPLDAIFIDADSKDSSLGMSAPPAAFVSIETLS